MAKKLSEAQLNTNLSETLYNALYEGIVTQGAALHLESHCDGEDVEEQVEVLRNLSSEKMELAMEAAQIFLHRFEKTTPNAKKLKKLALVKSEGQSVLN
jgi:hypothetical protein